MATAVLCALALVVACSGTEPEAASPSTASEGTSGDSTGDTAGDPGTPELEVMPGVVLPEGTLPRPAREFSMTRRGPGMTPMAYGGYDANGQPTSAAMWDPGGLATWKQFPSTGTIPQPRIGAALGWDAVNKKVVMFGGWNGLLLNDTWTFDEARCATTAGCWTKMSPPTSPPLTFRGSMATDPVTGRLLMYGGMQVTPPMYPGVAGTISRDLWTWDGSTWTKTSTRPDPVQGPYHTVSGTQMITANPAGNNIVMVEEQMVLDPNNLTVKGAGYHTWTWDGTRWQQMATLQQLPTVLDATLVTDYQTGQPVFEGGYPNTPNNEDPCKDIMGLPPYPAASASAAAPDLIATPINFGLCKAIKGDPKPLPTLPSNFTYYFDGLDWYRGQEASPSVQRVYDANRGDGSIAKVTYTTGVIAWQSSLRHHQDVKVYTQLAAGAWSTCGVQLLANNDVVVGNRVVCWGDNRYGQLGNQQNRNMSVPTVALLSPDPKSIAIGAFFGCALMVDTTVHCWGANPAGQLGDGTTTTSNVPTIVKNLRDVKQVAAGKNFACALQTSGAVWCWGANDRGQLGIGTTGNRSTPVQVVGLTGVTAIAAGNSHACAITGDKRIWCWGTNERSQLGNGATTDSTRPVQVAVISTATSLALGINYSCAIVGGGLVKCWGANDRGQLGIGTTADAKVPVEVKPLTGVTAISAGGNHACAIMASTAWCWGANDKNQVTSGGGTRLTPVALAPALRVATGWEHTCLIEPPPPGAPTPLSSVDPPLALDVRIYQWGKPQPVCVGDNASGRSGQAGVATVSTPTPIMAYPY